MIEDKNSLQGITKFSSLEDDLKAKVVLLNVFTISEGEKAEDLIKLAESATQEVIRYQPGFCSSTLHVSLDGNRVMNYVFWDSVEDFQNMLKNPDATAHMAEIRKKFPSDACLYKAVSTVSVRDLPQADRKN